MENALFSQKTRHHVFQSPLHLKDCIGQPLEWKYLQNFHNHLILQHDSKLCAPTDENPFKLLKVNKSILCSSCKGSSSQGVLS